MASLLKRDPLAVEFPSGLVPVEVSRQKPTTASVRALAEARLQEVQQMLGVVPEELPRPAAFLKPTAQLQITALQKQVDYLNRLCLFLMRRDAGTHELVIEDVHTRPTENECKRWTTEQIQEEAAEMHKVIGDIVQVGGDLRLLCVDLVAQGFELRKRPE